MKKEQNRSEAFANQYSQSGMEHQSPIQGSAYLVWGNSMQKICPKLSWGSVYV
jgi:hypothetical protein